MTSIQLAKKEPKQTVKYPLSIEQALYEKATKRAADMGINLAGYIRMLMINDLRVDDKK